MTHRSIAARGADILRRRPRGPAKWLALALVVGSAGLLFEQVRPAVLTQTAEPLEGTPTPATVGVTDHVVIISIDGLRADAIAAFRAPTLQKLVRRGRYSLNARTTRPALTLPAHASMLTGVPPAVHGITWNEDMTDEYGTIAVPTIFELARSTGLRTAAFFSKTKFAHFADPVGYDHLERPVNGLNVDAEHIEDAIDEYLEQEEPNLLFVHVTDPDHAGHNHGWMTEVYGEAVATADDAVNEIVQAADQAFGEGEYTLIVTSDHGGSGFGHGRRPEHEIIPWIVWGEGVDGQGPIDEPINTMDTAATALWLLGVDLPAEMVGKPVFTAFTSAVGTTPAP